MMIYVLSPIGFCQGVKNSLNLTREYKTNHPSENLVFARKIVHDEKTNNEIIQETKATILSKTTLFNENTTLIFSAHGLSADDILFAKKYHVNYLDTTCPILKGVQKQINYFSKKSTLLFFIGKKSHPETLAFLSNNKNLIFISEDEIDNLNLSKYSKKDKAAVFFQSTLGQTIYLKTQHHFLNYFYNKPFFGSICKECLKRWNKLDNLKVSNNAIFIILGSKSSSNANEFYKKAKSLFTNKCYFISNLEEIKKIKLEKDLYLMSATSFSNLEVDRIINYLKEELKEDVKII